MTCLFHLYPVLELYDLIKMQRKMLFSLHQIALIVPLYRVQGSALYKLGNLQLQYSSSTTAVHTMSSPVPMFDDAELSAAAEMAEREVESITPASPTPQEHENSPEREDPEPEAGPSKKRRTSSPNVCLDDDTNSDGSVGGLAWGDEGATVCSGGLADDDSGDNAASSGGEESHCPDEDRLHQVRGQVIPELPSLRGMAWGPSRRIVHDVVECGGQADVEQLLGKLLCHIWKLVFCLIVYHPKPDFGHCHVVHNCRWDTRQRRCGCPGMRTMGRTERRRVIVCSDRDERDFARLLQYLQKRDRRVVLQKTCDTLWVDVRLNPSRQLPQPAGRADKGMVAPDGPQRPLVDRPDGRGASFVMADQRAHGSSGATGKAIISFKKATPDSIGYIISRICAYPLHNARFTRTWHECRTCKYILPEDKIVKRACECVQLDCVYRSTRDFEEFYTDKHPVFRAYSGPLSDSYLTLEDSIAAVDALLMFQFTNSRDCVKRFLQDVLCVVDKKTPKKNCLEIESPPSAGKIFFIDMVTSFYLNCGNIANFNRNCQFPLQDRIKIEGFYFGTSQIVNRLRSIL